MGSAASIPAGTPFDELKLMFTEIRDQPPFGRWNGFIQLSAIKLFTADGQEFRAQSCENPNGDRGNNSEGPARLLETEDLSSKWLDDQFKNTMGSEIVINLGQRVCIAFYELCSGNDAEGRDPISW